MFSHNRNISHANEIESLRSEVERLEYALQRVADVSQRRRMEVQLERLRESIEGRLTELLAANERLQKECDRLRDTLGRYETRDEPPSAT